MIEDASESPHVHDAPSGDAIVADAAPPMAATRTGVAEIDAVLEDVDGLSERPVEEHVAVFEEAHQRLRRALDGEPDPSSG